MGALLENWQTSGFGIYVHWPFCAAKCPYCDFNSHVTKSIEHQDWAKAYELEIARGADLVGRRVVSSIFFGGGTPSLMAPDTVRTVIDTIAKHFSLANDIEITLEANPGSVDFEKFAAFADAGVNRVSIGIQALNDQDLKRLGRLHSVKDAETALDVAHAHFNRVSFDLIYARQHQNLSDWESELQQALSFDPDHLSLYQLTIEDGTAFGDRYARGKLAGLPNEVQSVDMFEATQTLCNNAGLNAYEVSNHAKQGAESLHNLIYWRSGDYLGIGPGAHGRFSVNGTRWESSCPRQPNTWISRAQSLSAVDLAELSLRDHGIEHLLMGLRLSEEYDLDRLEQQTGLVPPREKLVSLETEGYLMRNGSKIQVTPKGRLVLNRVILELIPD